MGTMGNHFEVSPKVFRRMSGEIHDARSHRRRHHRLGLRGTPHQDDQFPPLPQAIRAFLESDNFEDAVRKAVSLGGDSDTLACMAGGIAQAFFGCVPPAITSRVYEVLDDQLGMMTREFTESFGCP
jgi:ADP-ribosylglycohydrolase